MVFRKGTYAYGPGRVPIVSGTNRLRAVPMVHTPDESRGISNPAARFNGDPSHDGLS